MSSLPVKSIYLAIDTSIFENENYNFNSHNMQILKQYVKDGTIIGLLIPDIVVGEAKKHFRDRIIKANERIDKVLTCRELKPFTATKSLSNYIRPIESEKIVREMSRLLDHFLTDTAARIIKTDRIKLKDILNDYYNTVPPFGTGKKEHEFRDAIMIKRLKELSGLGEIVIVSADGDWSAAFENDNAFSFYNSLSDLFTSITKGQELSIKAQEFYLSNVDKINNIVEDRLSSVPCFVDGYEYDRKGVVGGCEYLNCDVQNISIKSKTLGIDYVGEDKVIARLYVQADFEIDCTYRDESNSIWDSDEKDYVYEEMGVIVENHCLSFGASAVYSVNNGAIEDCIDVTPHLKGKRLEFGEETLMDRRERNIDGFSSCKHSYFCPNCGHKIVIDLMDYADASVVSSDRGMGTEIEHTISYEGECPRCGKKYEINGEVYEYPIGAFNSDNTKISWE